jgi:ABC-type Co2+ transport system permease subunit
MNSRSFILSALIAGAVIGVLANLPVLNLINCFLCLWVWVGGMLAVYLYRRFQRGEGSLTGGQGAGLGAVAGLVGTFVGLIVYSLTSFISIPIFASVARFFQVEGDLPFKSGDAPSVVGSAVFFFMFNAVTYPLFGAISGLLAANLMGKKPAPQA